MGKKVYVDLTHPFSAEIHSQCESVVEMYRCQD